MFKGNWNPNPGHQNKNNNNAQKCQNTQDTFFHKISLSTFMVCKNSTRGEKSQWNFKPLLSITTRTIFARDYKHVSFIGIGK